jgi:general secretion pathway protein E
VELDRLVLRLAGSEEGPESAKSSDARHARIAALLADAARLRATAITLSPEGPSGRWLVRMRLGNRVEPWTSVGADEAERILAELDTLAPTGQPDRTSGRTILGCAEGLDVDLVRMDGQGAVLKVRPSALREAPALESLGMDAAMVSSVEAALERQSGLLVFAGPSGSGRTTTMQAFAEHLRVNGRDCWSVPAVGTAAGLQDSVRAVRRAGANVVIVDVDDDGAALPLCVDASLSGCLVLATMHASDASSALIRLSATGVHFGALAAVLRGVVAQRLLPALCESCRRAAPDQARALVRLADAYGTESIRQDYPELASHTVWRADGCDDCLGFGRTHQIAAYEFAPMSPELASVLIEPPDPSAISRALRSTGAMSLQQSTVARMLAGVVDAREPL